MVYLLNNISIFIWAFCIKHIKCKNKNSIFLFICFAQLTLIVGLRNEVGADYYSYLRIYNHLSGIWQYNYRYPEVEIGYELVNIIFGYFGIPYWGINLFMAFWTNLFIVLAIKEYKINICMSIFMYISLFFFYHSMNQTRQGLAMAIGIYAISQLCKKRNMAFVFWILFAMCFHTVAIVYLPLYLLRKIKITKKVLMLYLLGTIIVLVGYQFVVILLTYTKYGVYFNSYYDRSNALSTIINLVVRIVMLFLALFYAKKIKEGMSKNILYHMVLKKYLVSSSIKIKQKCLKDSKSNICM